MLLPSSFQENTFDRMIHFLNESNRLENIDEIDYAKKEFQKIDHGHFAALVESQKSALECAPLSAKTIERWQYLLVEESKETLSTSDSDEEKESIETVINEVNTVLQDSKKLQDDVEYCKFIGDIFQKIRKNYPIESGRLGRLLANYIATYCHRPIMIFYANKTEKSEYNEAVFSTEKMSVFIAKKVQEAIFGWYEEVLLKKEVLSGATSRYVSNNGKYQELYEWHSLKNFQTTQ